MPACSHLGLWQFHGQFNCVRVSTRFFDQRQQWRCIGYCSARIQQQLMWSGVHLFKSKFPLKLPRRKWYGWNRVSLLPTTMIKPVLELFLKYPKIIPEVPMYISGLTCSYVRSRAIETRQLEYNIVHECWFLNLVCLWTSSSSSFTKTASADCEKILFVLTDCSSKYRKLNNLEARQ